MKSYNIFRVGIIVCNINDDFTCRWFCVIFFLPLSCICYTHGIAFLGMFFSCILSSNVLLGHRGELELIYC